MLHYYLFDAVTRRRDMVASEARTLPAAPFGGLFRLRPTASPHSHAAPDINTLAPWPTIKALESTALGGVAASIERTPQAAPESSQVDA